MQSENRFFDDLGKIINGAAGTIAGVGREFEAVKAMAAAAREEAEQLKVRLDALEKKSRAAKPKTP